VSYRIYTQVSFRCDGCDRLSGSAETGHSEKVSWIRRELKRHGWTRVRRNGALGDFCPACSRNARKQTDPQLNKPQAPESN
jgi:hypothetical protein